MLLVTGFVLIFAASTLRFRIPTSHPDRTTEFVLAGLGNVIAASLLIIGAVLMLGRSRGARMGIVLGALISFGLAMFWLNQPDNEDDILWLFIFCAPDARRRPAHLVVASHRLAQCRLVQAPRNPAANGRLRTTVKTTRSTTIAIDNRRDNARRG